MEKRNCLQVAAPKGQQRQIKLVITSAAAIASIFVTGKSFATSGTWIGAGTQPDPGAADTINSPTYATDTAWTNSANWTGGVIPGANSGTFTNTDTATFGDTTLTGVNPVTTDINRNVQNIIFASASGAATQYAIGQTFTGTNPNNTLYLTGGGETLVSSNINPSGNEAINDPVVIAGSTYTLESDSLFSNGGLKFNGLITGSPTGPTTLTVTGVNYGNTGTSGNCQLNGGIADGTGGPLSLVKSSATDNISSVWTLAGTNTFTGGITINAGTLRLTGTVSSVNTLTINSGGQIRLGANTTFQSLTINGGGGDAGTSGSDTLQLAASSGPALMLQFEPAGVTPALSDPISLTGTGAAGSGGVTLTAGSSGYTGAFTLGSSSSNPTFNLGTISRIFEIDSGGNTDDLTIDPNVTGAGGGITKTGLGTMKLQGTANTFTGTIEVSNGTLKLNGSTTADTLSGSNALIIDGGTLNLNPDGLTAGDGNITVASTSFTSGTLAGATPAAATIQTPASLIAPSFNFNVALGNTFTVNAVLANGTGGPSPFITNVASVGTVTLNKANTYTGATTVNGGVLDISSTGSIVSTSVTIGNGATLNASGAAANSGLSTSTALVSSGSVYFTASGGSSITPTTLASVTVHTGGAVTLSDSTPANHGGRSVLITSALTLDGGTNSWGGKVNLNGNDLIVKGVGATGLANITNQLKEGFNSASGYWNGANGMVSTTAASDTTHLTALGSSSGGISFDGVSTSTSDVLVKYTYYGDANLDGTVNGADYQQIDNGFGEHLTGWQNGDFNYDGVVDGSDYSLIDNTFNQINATAAGSLAIVAQPSDLITTQATFGAVPEPTGLGLLGIAAMGLQRRRRKIQHPMN